MDQTTFANKIREKYPGAYDHVDDTTLVSKVIEKYPVYKDKVKMDTPNEDLNGGQLFTQDQSPDGQPENKNPTPWTSRAIGWAKGLVSGPAETAHLLQVGGQLMLAALDPTKTFEDVKKETGLDSLQGPQFDEIRKMSESNNKEETQGKVLEFVAELLWPTSKASEVASGLNKGKKLIGEGLDKGKQMLEGGAEKVVDKTMETAGKLKNKIMGVAEKTNVQKVEDDLFDTVREKVTPKYEEAAAKEGRMYKEGRLNEVKIKPSRKEELLMDSIRDIEDPETGVKLIDELKGKLPFEKIPRISEEISKIDQGVGNMIADRKVPFNMNQLKSKLASIKKDSDIVFSTDPTLEKTYDKLIEAFMKNVEGGDTKKLFDARKSFDKIPAVKKLLDGLKGATGENLRRQAVLDIRRAANEYVSELLPKNNPYKPLLKQETNLIEIVGNLVERSKGTTGTTEVSRLIKENPSVKALIQQIAPSFLVQAAI